jgi:hypothetical protein
MIKHLIVSSLIYTNLKINNYTDNPMEAPYNK